MAEVRPEHGSVGVMLNEMEIALAQIREKKARLSCGAMGAEEKVRLENTLQRGRECSAAVAALIELAATVSADRVEKEKILGLLKTAEEMRGELAGIEENVL